MINNDLSSLAQAKPPPSEFKFGNGNSLSFRKSIPRMRMSIAKTEEAELIRSSSQQEIFRVAPLERKSDVWG